MTMRLKVALRTTALLLVWMSISAKLPAQTPQFEVATVKQNPSETTDSGISTSVPDRFVATNVPVRFLLLYAYHLMDHQLAGAPEWTSDKAFDVVGIYPEHQRPADDAVRAMLQGVLAERFGLKVHHEQRELPAYDLVVAKAGRLGPQIHPSAVDCAALAGQKAAGAAGSSAGDRPVCATVARRTSLTAGARTMPELSATLQAMLGKPVVDKTGLAGRYDIDLHWAVTDLRAEGAGGDTSDGPSLLTAVGEQLGLKLVPHKEPFDVTVVDAIKLPSLD